MSWLDKILIAGSDILYPIVGETSTDKPLSVLPDNVESAVDRAANPETYLKPFKTLLIIGFALVLLVLITKD